MAIVTRFVAYFENGACMAGYEYDDAVNPTRITRYFIENNASGVMRLTFKRKSDGVILRTLDCEPGFAREGTLNNSTAQRIEVDISNQSKPRLTEYDLEAQYPYSEV